MDVLDVEGERVPCVNAPDDGMPYIIMLMGPRCMVRDIQAENADDWSYQKGLEGGWIPQDPTDRLYPDICAASGS